MEHEHHVLNLVIQDGTSHFIAELHIQQVRKLVLEMIQRLPGNDHLKPHVKNILSLAFKLLSKFKVNIYRDRGMALSLLPFLVKLSLCLFLNDQRINQLICKLLSIFFIIDDEQF